MSTDHRINNEAGFILHTYAFKETSVVAEVFTRAHGRVALIARGARRPASALRGLMQPFTPLLLSWFGKSELKTLHGAEWQGGLIAPQGRALMCGFYLNELMLRLLARGDAHQGLYDAYGVTLAQLAEAAPYSFEQILRRFEKTLLSETGYAATFDKEVDSGESVHAEWAYVYQAERGPWRANGEQRGAWRPDNGGHEGVSVSGQTLLNLAADHFDDAATLAEAKPLMRMLINHYLGAKPLYTRQLLRELTELHEPT
jgi:DNA repair protein RecO (recombination protein O)